jgi:thymidine phosphorylase
LASLFHSVAQRIELRAETVINEAHGPIGTGIGPRLEALDVLAVLGREENALIDLREKSLYLAGRLLEISGKVGQSLGYRVAQRAFDTGAAFDSFQPIRDAQGRRELAAPAPQVQAINSIRDGRINSVDCWEISRVAKRAGAPANSSAGVKMLCVPSDVVREGDPIVEVHAESRAQLDFACRYAASRPSIIEYGF